MSYTELKRVTVSSDIFNSILEKYSVHIEEVDNIENYMLGYKNDLIFYYDGIDTIIMKEMFLFYLLDDLEGVSNWKQIVVRRDDKQGTKVEKDVNGRWAYHYMKRLINKYYSDEDYELALSACEAEYNDDLIQYHFWSLFDNTRVVYKHTNCVKYDINGAHTDAICEIFPKAKRAILAMHNKRKEHPEYKKYINYFVGYLKKIGYDRTYNWIVQRTTKILKKAIDEVGGILLYANTDGFMVKYPNKKLNTSTNLGEFKLEFEGTTYFYTDKNYTVFQYEKDGELETTGSILCQLRDKLILKEGKVVHYDRYLDGKVFKPINISEEVLCLV